MTQTYTDRAAPVLDNSEYPTCWPDYIGQFQAKTSLQVAAQSAFMREVPMDHTLIVGPSGVGKTALAVLVSGELRRDVRVISGPVDSSTARLILLGMKDRDVVFCDEAHSLFSKGRNNAEWLLNYLQDNCIAGPLGMEPMPKVTFILATSRPQTLPPDFLRRCINRIHLLDYSVEEGMLLVTKMSEHILGDVRLPKVSGADAEALAIACHRMPGTIKRVLTVLRDVSTTGHIAPKGKGKGYDIPALLAYLDIEPDGLTSDHRRYLTILAEEFAGKAGGKTLEDRLMASESLDLVERPLIDSGYIVKTKQGRALTAAGITRYHELRAAA